MRLPRVQFTLRRLIVAVALVGTILGVLAGRRSQFRGLAAYHSAKGRAMINGGLPRDDSAAWKLERDLWHGVLAEKYKRAARYPWLPVAPDPPEPAFEEGRVERIFNEDFGSNDIVLPKLTVPRWRQR